MPSRFWALDSGLWVLDSRGALRLGLVYSTGRGRVLILCTGLHYAYRNRTRNQNRIRRKWPIVPSAAPALLRPPDSPAPAPPTRSTLAPRADALQMPAAPQRQPCHRIHAPPVDWSLRTGHCGACLKITQDHPPQALASPRSHPDRRSLCV